jgi:hypothetical protein
VPRPPAVLDAPAPVQPRRSGLFLAATGPMENMDVHVTDVGATWWTDACGNARLYPAGCSELPYSPFQLDLAGGMEYAYPFHVYGTTVCPPVGVTGAESRERVLRRLAQGEEKAVERAFWGGQALIDNPPGQTDTPVIKGLVQLLAEEAPAGITLLAGTAATVKEAVSRLEQHAADSTYNGPLLLHARPGVAAYTGGLIRDRVSSDGEHQYTQAGSEWVFGRGYSGASPDNVTPPDATTEYMIITGRVFIWRAPQEKILVSAPDQILDKITNQRGMIADRPYAIGVDCYAAAVKFTRA